MIQTVTGKIENKSLGKALIHEHISCASNDLIKAFGKTWLDRDSLEDYASDTLSLLKEKYNLGLFVDGTPIDLGRDAILLKNTSLKSGMPIVASTGFYLFKTLGVLGTEENELADLLIYECTKGMEGTDVKPGILKCATVYSGLNTETLRKHAAVGITQKETGLPVYVHCEHNENVVFDQIDILKKYGANPEKLVIGHTAHRPSADYLESVLKTGCYISIDQCHCFPDRLTEIAESVLSLCKKGYGDKILISGDLCIHNDFAARKTNGLHLDKFEQAKRFGYMFDKLYCEFLAVGGNPADWEKMTEQNPYQVLDV
ncbi:MAG: TatD family hydrolase [Clostridia bacterium]|nr:TatD family hydrolase [Clostridia bacterium]